MDSTIVGTKQVMQQIANECNAFVDQFLSLHCEELGELPVGPYGRVDEVEQKPEWHQLYKRFTEEAELTLQSAMMAWGVVFQKAFEEGFLSAAQDSRELDTFLDLTEYAPFMQALCVRRQQLRESNAYGADGFRTPVMQAIDLQTSGRLAEVDYRLAQLEQERNALLAERRRLVGCTVEPTTATELKHQIMQLRWKEDVGLD